MASQADLIDALTQRAVAKLRTDVAAIIARLRVHLAGLLARAKTKDGKLEDVERNIELAAKLEAGWSRILKAAGYDGALGELLDTYEEIAEANGTFIEDKLGRSFSSANLRSLSRLASGSVDRLLLRGEEAGAKLREILVHGAHASAPLADLLDDLAQAAGVTLRQAVVEAETQLMAFHRDGLAVESFEAGIDLYVYDGPDDGITRPFCEPLVGKIVTLPDLDDMENDGPKPVSRFLGGYRCRHSLSPISLEEAEEMVEQRGASAIAPGARLAKQILLKGKEGPAAKAFRIRMRGELVNGKVVRGARA